MGLKRRNREGYKIHVIRERDDRTVVESEGHSGSEQYCNVSREFYESILNNGYGCSWNRVIEIGGADVVSTNSAEKS